MQKCSIWSLVIAPPASPSAMSSLDVESMLDGWLTPEVMSLDEPRPPSCNPLLFDTSFGDW